MKQWRLVLKLPKGEHAIYFGASHEDAQATLQETLSAIERGGPATIADKLYVVDTADIELVSLFEVSSSE